MSEPFPRSATPPAPRGLLHPSALLAVTVFGGLICVVLSPSLSIALGLPELSRWFMDSVVILAANDAVAAGLDPYKPLPYDLLHRPHVYSSWWLHLRHLGLTRGDNFLFGGAFVVVFLAVAGAMLRPKTLREALFFAALLLSPPTILAINRANNDLVIFALLGGPLLLLRDHNPAWKIALLGAAVFAAAGLKFYPIVAVAAFALIDRPLTRALAVTFLVSAAALVVLWLERQGMATSRFTIPATLHVFGAGAVFHYHPLPGPVTTALAALTLGAAAGWLVRRKLTVGLNVPAAAPASARWLFAAGACLLLGCFLAGVSYAYRLIFVLWLCPWLWHLSRQPATQRLGRLTLAVLLLSVWSDGLFCLVINLGVRSYPPFLEQTWLYVSQGVHWVFMALLAGWLLDAGIRTFITLLPAARGPAPGSPALTPRS